ncbi:olfactory receptor 1102-like [Eublepharis macularius]|uniref:Olfactory receptor n=1 Tax=Eublepharis macularius TaxID=481883 RepID=A0AA97K5D9_EUBMA|nr:olfactory receptor 1102-like [Eublepharis macularius]
MGVGNLTSVTEFILEGLTIHRKTQILLFVIILIVYVLTLMGNLIIIMLVQADSSLQTPMYFFLTNLSSLEICYVAIMQPQILAHLISGNGIISYTRCVVQIFVVLTLGTVECFLLGIMAYDRYLAIFHPLMYAINMSRLRQLQLASTCWAIGLLFGMIYVCCTFRHFYCGPNHINHFMCEMPVVLKLACDDTHITEAIVFVMAALVLLVPVFVILTSYGLILYSVLQIKSAAGRRKAFSTCAAHLVVVTVFYGTVISMYMIPRSSASSNRDKKIAVFYVVVAPLLNPVIYTLRNKDVHRAAAKVLRRQGVKHDS